MCKIHKRMSGKFDSSQGKVREFHYTEIVDTLKVVYHKMYTRQKEPIRNIFFSIYPHKVIIVLLHKYNKTGFFSIAYFMFFRSLQSA